MSRTIFRSREVELLRIPFAVGDGVTDDTAAIQASIDAGPGRLYLPPGTYKVSRLTIPSNVTLEGGGAQCTTLKTTEAEGDVISVLGQGVQIRNLGFDSFPKRIGGSYVNFGPQSSCCSIDHFQMFNAYIGVTLSGTISMYAEHGLLRDIIACGVRIDGGQDQYLRCLTMDNDTKPATGIHINSTGNANISDCDIIHCGYDLLITGGYSIYVRDCFFDTARMGIFIAPTTPVERCHFHGCWTSGHEGHGVLIDPNSPGSVDTIDFIGHHSFGNGNDGIHLGKGNNLKVIGSSCCDNMSGLGVGAQHVIIQGNRLGATGSMPGNEYGCFFLPGAEQILMTGNDVTGNKRMGKVGTPPNSIFANNLGDV